MAMSGSDLIMYEEEFSRIDAELRKLHQQANATVVFLVDKNGQLIASAGETHGIDTTSLASLNEVGGEPQLPADDPVAALHHANAQRAAVWPRTMLCVTTHDTKRTADVRARLDVLAELPNLWTSAVARWRRLNQVHRRRVGGKRTPDAGMEYLCYQTMLGLWPAPDPGRPDETPAGQVLQDLRERIEAYLIKAAREAKTYTSWINEDREYEDALVAFVRSLFLAADNRGSSFLAEVQRLAARVARPGFWNSLSRTLIQFTAPGTPDIYQGDELWNFALVDPDNRRGVDYHRRRQLLDEQAVGLFAADRRRPNADPHDARFAGRNLHQPRKEDESVGGLVAILAFGILAPGHRFDLHPQRHLVIVANGDLGRPGSTVEGDAQGNYRELAGEQHRCPRAQHQA